MIKLIYLIVALFFVAGALWLVVQVEVNSRAHGRRNKTYQQG